MSDELILPHPGGGQRKVSQGQQGEAGSDEATGSRCYKTLQNNSTSMVSVRMDTNIKHELSGKL